MTSYAGRWSANLVLNTEKKYVMIYPNGNFVDSKSLYMEGNWTISDFLVAASQRLGITPTAKRVFNSDGMEIDDCMMIEDNDILFISLHQDFMPPAPPEPTIDSPVQSHRRGSLENLPTSVGGFIVGKFLGRGGFGEVRLGEHQLTGERVALKFLRKSDLLTMGAAERTATEIQCLTTMRHTGIIRLQHHTESANHVVLVFELMEGGDLYKYLISRGTQPHDIALSEDEARLLFVQLVNAVSYAHNQHICHRDLKLENILLKGPTLACVKIADFGLSDFYRPGIARRSNCGTLSFQAPESLKSTASAGPPLDVWSLGVILFAVLCGRLPFEGTTVGASRPRETVIKAKILKGAYKVDDHLSVEAKDLLRRVLHIDATERASMPDIFNHCWLMASSALSLDAFASSKTLSAAERDRGGGGVADKHSWVKREDKLEPPDRGRGRGALEEAIGGSRGNSRGGSRGGPDSGRSTPLSSPSLLQASSDILDAADSVSGSSETAYNGTGSVGGEAPPHSPSFKLIPLRRNISRAEVDADKDSLLGKMSSPAFESKTADRSSWRASGTFSMDGLAAERDSIDELMHKDSASTTSSNIAPPRPHSGTFSPTSVGRKRIDAWDSSTSPRQPSVFSSSSPTLGSSSDKARRNSRGKDVCASISSGSSGSSSLGSPPLGSSGSSGFMSSIGNGVAAGVLRPTPTMRSTISSPSMSGSSGKLRTKSDGNISMRK